MSFVSQPALDVVPRSAPDSSLAPAPDSTQPPASAPDPSAAPPFLPFRLPSVLARLLPFHAALLFMVLRVVALDSDAYSRLSWSSALLTDEGFYLHNARNVVLFHRFSTDQFNNALIMPLLHVVQLGWFQAFGVSALSARLLSVTFSLATLLVFFAALRRAFGSRVAWTATVLLGLDHVNLLYNRLALMDTPAAFWMAVVLYAFVCATQAQTAQGRNRAWLACGLLLGAVYATRGVAAFLLPVPFLLLLRQAYKGEGQERRQALVGMGALACGLAVALAVYVVFWYEPHHAEIARVNHYYLTHQLLPHSLNALRQNLTHAVIGDHRGMSPYLFRHTPVQFALVLALLSAECKMQNAECRVQSAKCRVQSAECKMQSAEFNAANVALADQEGIKSKERSGVFIHHSSLIIHHFLCLWLLLAWLAYACISYAPDRYYVLFYPALAALTALALADIQNVARTVWESRLARTLLGGFMAYHFAEAFLHHANAATDALLYAFTFGTALLLCVAPRFNVRSAFVTAAGKFAAGYASAILLLLWGGINAGWTFDWLAHLRYTQRDADRWLARNLPPDTVLVGDVAPGLCLSNRFRAVVVIPGLCNDDRPIERAAPAPVAVVILDAQFKEPWWQTHYPGLVAPSRRTILFPRVVRFPVGVYYQAK